MRGRAWLVAVTVVAVAGCGGRAPGAEGGDCGPDGSCDQGLVCVDESCVSVTDCGFGDTGSCPCPEGTGVRTCQSDFTWGACLCACGDGWCDTEEDAVTCPADCEGVEEDVFEQSLNNKADILFMVDNSNSMEPKQASLNLYFPNFVQPLKDLPTRPDLHIGIITSNLGAGQFTPPSCDTIGGDQGILQNTPNGTTCATAHLNNSADRYLAYTPDPTGVAAVNFTGDIADAFACYSSVGVGGCGFEHQLASVRAALDGCESDAGCKQRQNEGFFRKDAYLSVIILTDEDDCSAPLNSTLFDPLQTTVGSELGPLTSYRCFEFGNLCGGHDPGRSEGSRYDCVPGNKDSNPTRQLIPTQDFATFLKGLKPQDPRMVFVSVIAGPPMPITVGTDANGYPDLQAACTGGMGAADPAPRLAQLVSWFDDDRASYITVCQPDLSQAMAKIANEMAMILGNLCLGAPLKLDAGLPACVVQDRTLVNGDTRVTVPACNEAVCDPASAPGGDCKCQQHSGASPSSPCWYVWPDEATCPMLDANVPIAAQTHLGSGYQVRIDRGTDAACNSPQPTAAAFSVVQCRSCDTNPAENRYDCSPGCADYWPGCCPTPSPGCFQ